MGAGGGVPGQIRFPEPIFRSDWDCVTVPASNLVVLVVVLTRSRQPQGLPGRT